MPVIERYFHISNWKIFLWTRDLSKQSQGSCEAVSPSSLEMLKYSLATVTSEFLPEADPQMTIHIQVVFLAGDFTKEW